MSVPSAPLLHVVRGWEMPRPKGSRFIRFHAQTMYLEGVNGLGLWVGSCQM